MLVNREKTRIRMMKRRNLGTSDFSEHGFYDDFDRERYECLSEIRRLGVKRQFS